MNELPSGSSRTDAACNRHSTTGMIPCSEQALTAWTLLIR